MRTPLTPAGWLAAIVAILLAINGVRAEPLRLDDRLMVAAQEHAQVMADAGEIFHSDLSRYPGVVVGENVGVGPSWEAVQEGFEGSESHYANLTNPEFRSVGIGIVETDRVFVVQAFSDVVTTHADGIDYVTGEGLMVGFPDGTFRPDEPVTRGQLATVLEKLAR